MFRFDYSKPFLHWALTPPGFHKDWHVGVRSIKTNALLACITGIPAEVRVHDSVMKMCEINFLCVHKKLRSKRLAPVLIKEITRRVNLLDIWQAVYTAGVVLPRPIGRCRYWHRSLNPKKLIEIKFSRLAPRMTMARTIKLYRLPDQPNYPFSPMTESDLPSAHRLLMEYLRKTKLAPQFTVAELGHILLPKEGVVDSYVMKNEAGEVTDMCSMYHLPSTIIGNPKYDKLHVSYAYYNVATTITWTELMRDLLIFARNRETDVLNCLDLMDNQNFLEPLKFGQGDGNLQYYVYNWKCQGIEANEVGLVLL